MKILFNLLVYFDFKQSDNPYKSKFLCDIGFHKVQKDKMKFSSTEKGLVGRGSYCLRCHKEKTYFMGSVFWSH